MLQNHPAGKGTKLGWVAIQHGADRRDGSFNILDLATRTNTRFRLPGRPGFFAETTRPGVVLLGLERRLALFDYTSGSLSETGIAVTADERCIINDGLAMDAGVIFGTKHLAFSETIAELYYFDSATRRVRSLLGGQTCSNGKLFLRHEAGATLIDIDSSPKTVTRYRLGHALDSIMAEGTVVAPHALPAFPDGMRPTHDERSVVIAFYNPEPVADGVARAYSIDTGEVECEWVIPGSPRVTCPEFLELDGKVKLLFTTAMEGMPEEIRSIAPGAGCLYLADTPYKAIPAPPPLVHWGAPA